MGMYINYRRMVTEMARKCMGVKDLAASAGVSTSAIYAAQQGKKTRPQTAGKIAAALGLDVAELLEEAGA